MSDTERPKSGGDQVSSDEINQDLPIIVTGGETINGATLPVAVFQKTSDNEFYACDANDPDRLEFAGFIISNTTDGNDATFQHKGKISGFSGLDEGERYYVQNDKTIGKVPGQHRIYVGKAVSATEILIEKEGADLEFSMGASFVNKKGFHNFNIPLFLGTNISSDIWTTVSVTPTHMCGSALGINVSAPASWEVGTTNEIFADVTGNNTPLLFNNSKKIIVEWSAKAQAAGTTEQFGAGLSQDITRWDDYDDQTVDSCGFTVDTSGNLYAKTSDGGVGHTETQIAGITLTNMNTYRIVFNPGVDAKFYVNGVLKATITTNLPNGATVILFGWGGSGNTSNEYWSTITQPFFAIEK